ncbi:MAG: hypothetical protein HQK49_01410 [Oligoflexia bacterium]|nr:hypothetical protein [Oligoflexia bacterium]
MKKIKNILIISFTITYFVSLISCIDENSRRSIKNQISKNSLNNSSDKKMLTPSPSHSPSSSPPVKGLLKAETAATIELRFFVDPNTGTFKDKVTIPKNFNGILYLSGLNITSLNNRIVKVRFKFGRELEVVTVPATIGRAAGLTPQIDIQVLIMDMRDRPFENIRLLYDLYDYNTYNYDYNDSPTNDPYNRELYCRGLTLEYDPTYTNGECNPNEKKCLYAFAKIKDAGLYTTNGSTIPTLPLIDINSGDFTFPTASSDATIVSKNLTNIKKCLPDNGAVFYKEFASSYRQMTYTNVDTSFASYNDVVLSLTDDTNSKVDYYYRGPYRVLSLNSWSLPKDKAVGPYGLFKSTLDSSADPTDVTMGIFSLIFPRSGKLPLDKEIKYIGDDYAFKIDPQMTPTPTLTKTIPRSITSLTSAGDTKWMDGCNIRVSNFDETRNEGINSCNVSATIEIVAIDPKTGKEYDVDMTNKTEIKLQLSRPSTKDYQGKETLYQSMKSCSSSRTCASDECCFNKRCWSKNLVSQCLEDATSSGQQEIGTVCNSDFQCASLCCNVSIGRCAVHNSKLDTPVFCSKSPGDHCVAKEWCRKDTIQDCKIIRTGINSQGEMTCALRCYNKQEFGSCINGICVAPTQPGRVDFNEENPDCKDAVPPPLVIGDV